MPWKPNTIEDFWRHVDKNGPEVRPGLGRCWIFGPQRKRKTYGVFQMNKVRYRTHRWSYEMAYGPFDPKLDVLHACDTPACVNPAHLSLGSDQENMLDASAKRRHVQSKKTHCPKGHPYAGPNLGMSKHHNTKSGKGWNRVCKACHAQRQSERYRRQRGLITTRARD